MKPETPIAEQEIYNGKLINFKTRQSKLVDGTLVDREIVQTNGAVVIVAITSKNEVKLLRQFRAAAEKWIIELPAGSLEKGEDPAVAAPRELLEETGDQANNWHYLGGFYTAPGILTEYLHLYLATELTPGQTQLEFDEHIENITVPWNQAIEMLKAGQIEDAKTIAGLTQAALHLNLPIT